ncbi:MAG: hypothetical protein KDI09_06780 [Halioglobus sp.]|nr:hypothetical protein [Halioglobus sp.]
MSAAKMVMLLIYAVLAGLALGMGEAAVGVWSLRILVLLAAVHAVETVVFFGLCKRAGGSLPMQLLNVFLFGVLHVQELKARGVQ